MWAAYLLLKAPCPFGEVNSCWAEQHLPAAGYALQAHLDAQAILQMVKLSGGALTGHAVALQQERVQAVAMNRELVNPSLAIEPKKTPLQCLNDHEDIEALEHECARAPGTVQRPRVRDSTDAEPSDVRPHGVIESCHTC